MPRLNKNQVRIIGGRWRGRRIHFPDHVDLRPTSDRIRETIFNWLAPHLSGSHCLDLFAGSGALGFEALSRGVTQVTFVDQSRIVCQQLRHTAQQLEAQQAIILQAELPMALARLKHPADIVFLDPPFHSTLLQACVTHLANTTCLHTHSLVYVEYNPKCAQITLPSHWQLWRSQQAGQVCYQLWRVDENASDA